MPALFVTLGLVSLALGAQPQPASSGRPILVAHADGSWEIGETIGEDGPALAVATHGLVIDDEEWLEAQAADDISETESEAAARRAFEEAVDVARQESTPQ